MIRKAIIVVLTLAAAAMGTIIVTFHDLPLRYKSEGSYVDASWSLRVEGGSVSFSYESGLKPLSNEEIQSLTNPTEESRTYYKLFGFGALWKTATTSYGFPRPSPHSYWVALVFVPSWFIFILLAVYPAVSFIRGPVRQYRLARRRRKGLCAECGYDLTGNESGKCPECGVQVEQRRDCSRH